VGMLREYATNVKRAVNNDYGGISMLIKRY